MYIERRVLCGGLAEVLTLSAAEILSSTKVLALSTTGLATTNTKVSVFGQLGNTRYIISVHSIQ